jgi:hypothetical protein
VVVRRGGELHLAAIGERPPAGQDLGENPPLGREDPLHVRRLVVALAGDERAQLRVVGQCPESHPGQVEVHLEVA